jgi:hypothetical protein
MRGGRSRPRQGALVVSRRNNQFNQGREIMTRIAQSKCFGVLAAAALFWTAAMSQAQATTLDKLIGTSLTVGNLVFSNFAAPSFVGAGPNNIDVQGIVVTDPDTGKQQTGLRFVAPFFSESLNGGPHEIVLNVLYVVTATAGQLNTTAQTMKATATGQAAVYYFTQASPAPGFIPDTTLTFMDTCIVGGAFACVNTPASAALYAGNSTFYMEHQVQLLISKRKGATGGTTTLQGFDVLYGE